MERLPDLRALADWRSGLTRCSLGLVPTMGCLHPGHLSLVERSVAENERTLATIFVNPAQFDDPRDLESYPRTLDDDCLLLTEAGCDAVFVPPVHEIYPPGFQTMVRPGDVARALEGESRPGHFDGVATVVLKLFNLTRPTRAYFGRKDAQQLAVVRQMVRDLAVPVEIVGCPTRREPDGLAMSSRNALLSPEDRRAATILHTALERARELHSEGERQAHELRAAIVACLTTEPRGAVDYASVADPTSLAELSVIEGDALVSLAVRFGRIRLIDNLLLTADESPAWHSEELS